MKKVWHIALAVALGLGAGFYLHSAAAQRGVSIRALIGLAPPTAPPISDEGWSIFYRILAPVYDALPRHAAIVMLGDSITTLTDWSALLPEFDVANRGIPGDTTAGVLKRINGVVAMQPQCVAVMLGINDLALGKSVEAVAENYTAIVHRLSASGAKVIVQSTLATSQSYAWLNPAVIIVNRSLGEMCRTGRCAYLDLNARDTLMADTADGIHVGQLGYRMWAATLTPLLKEFCSTRDQ